jgi:PilZ domain
MTALAKPDPRPVERRATQRVKVTLLGRFMRQDRAEFACQTIDMSPGSVAFRSPIMPPLGQRVVAYLDQVGRVEGKVTRHFEAGFAIQMTVAPLKREKLADQLTWLANRLELGMKEDRRHERIAPMHVRTTLKTADGREYLAKLIDISISGAAMNTDAVLLPGAPVTVGETNAKVVRVFQGGVAIEFIRPFAEDTFSAETKL